MHRSTPLVLLLASCASPLGTFEPVDDPQRPARPELRDVLGASAVLEDQNPDPGIVEVSLVAGYTTLTLGEGMTYELMTYNGVVPGPLLHAAVGDEVVIHFTNELDEPTTIHWHGLRIPDDMDGSPRIQDPVQPGETFVYRFVVPEAGTFWYHPHVRANQQVELGLYGPFIVRDAFDPEYDRERVIVLDDLLVDPDTMLLPPFLASHMEAMHGRFGNVLLTNGREVGELDPGVAPEGSVERWRVLNTSNARTMELAISGARWRVIGTDGGLLREPFETDRLVLAVGQRYDVEVAYDGAGRVELQSFVVTLDETGALVEVPRVVYAVDVGETGEAPHAVVRPLRPARAPREETGLETLRFDMVSDPEHGLVWRINGEAHRHEPLFTFRQGDTVRFALQNSSSVEHPFHLHGQFFEILPGSAWFTQQPGLKDTVLVPGGAYLELVAYLDNPGRWMAHCHILEHAELGMMTEIVIEPAP